MPDINDPRPPNHLRRAVAIALTTVSCAAAVAACGSSGKPHGPSANAGIKFADCMRSHGVPNFPDPGSGGGVQITPDSGVNPRSPAFQSAQKACAKLLPGLRRGGGPGSESRRLMLLRLAQCMRRHGLSTFPDPTSTAPSGPPSGGGIGFGSPGAFLSVPENLIQSPGFKQAAAACKFPGFGGAGPKRAPAP